MAAAEKSSIVGDLRTLLQDVVTPDLKALAVRVDSLEGRIGALDTRVTQVEAKIDRVESKIDRLDERQERRFDRMMSAPDVYKEVQDLKEFRIRTEERQKASA